MDKTTKLKEIQERLKNQDNRATANPIFVVYDWDKVPSCKDYTETFEYIWSDEGYWIGDTKEELIKSLKDADWELPQEKELTYMSADELMRWVNEHQREETIRKFYYIKKRVFINVFFTEESANNFIKQNQHNLTGEVHTYVNCLFRNPEMQFIRNSLKDGLLTEVKPKTEQEICHIINEYEKTHPHICGTPTLIQFIKWWEKQCN